MSFQVRPVSHAVSQLRPTNECKTTQNVYDEESSVDCRKAYPNWKSRFINELRIRKPIPVLRLPREQQKAGSIETHSNKRVSGIVIHPFHRSSFNRKTDPATDSDNLRPPRSTLSVSSTRPEDHQDRDALLQIISNTQSTSEAWEAYDALLSAHTSRVSVSNNVEGPISKSGCNEPTIPYPHLHRLARLLSSTHPRTRQLFLRLLSVLTTLRSTGGSIFVWEWNALMDCAGKGWRKISVEDYRAAVGIFQDMVTSSGAASSTSEPRHAPPEWGGTLPADRLPVEQPDITTFTTLLDIASRTLNDKAIHHAMSLLAASELPWNNVTHMARLPYFIHTNQLQAVRGILMISVTRGLDICTLNGCLWAYAYKGRLRMVMQVYDLLRRNIPAEDRANFGESDRPPFSLDPENYMGVKGRDKNPILDIPGFITQATMAPDVVTYTLLVQALCYHGDLIGALTVFRDMVTTVDPASRQLGSYRGNKQLAYHKPTYAIYRAIFLGFARHANKRPPTLASSLMSKHRGIDTVPLREFAARLTASYPNPTVLCPSPEELTVETPWSLETLDKIFERFLEMDWELDGRNGVDTTAPTLPSDRMIYWIMVAYAKATNRNIRRMYDVWKQLNARFGYESAGVKLGGRLGRIDRELEERQTNGDDSL